MASKYSMDSTLDDDEEVSEVNNVNSSLQI